MYQTVEDMMDLDRQGWLDLKTADASTRSRQMTGQGI